MGERRPTRRPPGQPTKLLNDTTVEVLIDALKAGAPVGLACEAASIAKSTFYGWMSRGYEEHARRYNGDVPDPGEDLYVDIYEKVQEAKAAAALRNVVIIQRVANGGTVLERTTERDPDGTERVIEKRQAPDWRAAAWYLERVTKGEFAKEATQVELSGPDGGPVDVRVDAMDLSKRLAEHLAVGAATTPLAIESERVDDAAPALDD